MVAIENAKKTTPQANIFNLFTNWSFANPSTKRQKLKKICIVCEKNFYPSLINCRNFYVIGEKFCLSLISCRKILKISKIFFIPQLVGIENILLFGFLLKIFYSLTNQLGKIRRKIRNYFSSPQVVGSEKCQN